jgi:signal transduction histidine kinase
VRRSGLLSVRWRITAGATLLAMVAFLVAAFTSAALFDRGEIAKLKAHLALRVDDVELLIKDGLLRDVLSTGGHATDQVVVVDRAGTLVSQTRGLAAANIVTAVAMPPRGRQTTTITSGAAIGDRSRDQVIVVARTVSSGSAPTTIYVLADVDPHHGLNFLLDRLLLIFAPLALFATLLTSFIVRRALAPVDAMRAAVDRIETTDMSDRVSVGPRPDELSRLGQTLNRMLDRMEEAGAQQRAFAGAASHELRSPLSAIRTELEVGLTYPDRADWPKIATESLIEVTRLEELSRDLRTLTRSAAAPGTRQRLNLTELVDDELHRRQPPARMTYRKQLDPSVVVANLDEVLRVVRNLFDNAERHARTLVMVALAAGPHGVTLSVHNDGAPIPASDRERIFEPFMRLDEARAYDDGGSGLGLAIARSVMKSSGGSLHVAALDEGAEFIAWFPRG